MFPFAFSFVAPTASGLADIDNAFSMAFDGIDDYISTGLNLGYTTYPTITISCWIKMDKADLATFTSYNPVGVLAGAYPNSSAVRLYTDGTKKATVAVQGSGTVYTSTDLSDGNWHNIISTYVYDAAGTVVNVYVDGTKEITDKLLLSFAPLTGDLYIGARDATNWFFVGEIDEVAIFNYAVDPDDISKIYDATSSGKTADLSDMTTPPVAWYRMGD